ncbi:MAG: TetR/AcrR family transcriptional regulator [Planctomycetota bacterium]|jgi:AcrR family transcriptional regulator
MAGKAAKIPRLGARDWLVEALETLGREGVIGVSVENVARSMGATKGSFYHHFKNKEELIHRLLEYWETELTDKIDGHVAHLHGKPAEQLLALLEFIAENETNRYDAAMRAWALHDERVATVVRRVDQKRLAYVRALFRKMGFPAEQADMRGRMSYYDVVGEHSALAEERTLESRLKDIKLRHELLTGWRAAVNGSPS